MFPRVAFEYGQTPCAFSASSRATPSATPGISAEISTMIPNPSSFFPSPTFAVTRDPDTSIPACRATTASAPWKHALYPAANSCSGLVPAPLPPSSLGGLTTTSSRAVVGGDPAVAAVLGGGDGGVEDVGLLNGHAVSSLLGPPRLAPTINDGFGKKLPHTGNHRQTYSLTIIFPVLSPRRTPRNASRLFSMPSTTVSRYFSCPEATHGPTSATNCGCRS